MHHSVFLGHTCSIYLTFFGFIINWNNSVLTYLLFSWSAATMCHTAVAGLSWELCGAVLLQLSKPSATSLMQVYGHAFIPSSSPSTSPAPPIQWLLAKLNGPGSGGFSLITNRDPTEISWSSAEPGIIKSVSKPSRMVYNKSIFPLHLLKWQHRIVLFFLRRRKVLSCTSSLWDLILWPIRKVCVGSSTLIWSIVTVLSLQQKLSQFKKLLVT